MSVVESLVVDTVRRSSLSSRKTNTHQLIVRHRLAYVVVVAISSLYLIYQYISVMTSLVL